MMSRFDRFSGEYEPEFTDVMGPYDWRSFSDINYIKDNFILNNPNSNEPVSDEDENSLILAPYDIILNTEVVYENEKHVAYVSGSDPNGDTLIYNVLSDNVGGMLEIIGSKLQFKDNFTADYEILQDLQFTLGHGY